MTAHTSRARPRPSKRTMPRPTPGGACLCDAPTWPVPRMTCRNGVQTVDHVHRVWCQAGPHAGDDLTPVRPTGADPQPRRRFASKTT